jgi:transposase-like protein
MVIRVREEDVFCGRSALIAVGINENGYREVLGLMIGDSESEKAFVNPFHG